MYERIVEQIVELIRKDEQFIDFASYPLRGKQTSGEIILKVDNIVLSGVSIVNEVLKKFSVESKFYHADGELVSSGVIAELTGDSYNILICERTILNVLSFMSSIATKVNQLVTKAKGTNVIIAATRKTIPFAGELQKIAVIHGGGDTHRLNLSDCAMIKDNHIKLYGSVSEAIRQVRKALSFSKKIEVEVENEKMAMEACKEGADIVMLDNFGPEQAYLTAKRIKEKYPNVIIEISGGINEQNLEKYLCEYIDVISIGRITSEIKYVDFSLEISSQVT
ncbi:MAG: carboxylating nicotinate-nucleotide diphosphorylase [Fervidobacterium sp.]